MNTDASGMLVCIKSSVWASLIIRLKPFISVWDMTGMFSLSVLYQAAPGATLIPLWWQVVSTLR